METEVEDVGRVGTATAGVEGTPTGVESIVGSVDTARYMYHNYKCHTYTEAEPRTPELSADMLPLSHPYGGEQIALKQHGSHCFPNTNMYHFFMFFFLCRLWPNVQTLAGLH